MIEQAPVLWYMFVCLYLAYISWNLHETHHLETSLQHYRDKTAGTSKNNNEFPVISLNLKV